MGIASGAASGPGRACQPCVAVYLFVCVCVCVCVLRSKVQECIRASCAGAMTGDGGMEPQMERSCPSRVKSQWRGEHGASCSVLAWLETGRGGGPLTWYSGRRADGRRTSWGPKKRTRLDGE